ncbi:MAG: hypothetical protein ABIH82_00485 [Candidatus Woesearchaeota archaeon]
MVYDPSVHPLVTEHKRAFDRIEVLDDLLRHEKVELSELTSYTDRKIIFILERAGIYGESFVGKIALLNDLLQNLIFEKDPQKWDDVVAKIQFLIIGRNGIQDLLKKAWESILFMVSRLNQILKDEEEIRLAVANFYHEGTLSALSDEDEQEMTRLTELVLRDLKLMRTTLLYLKKLFVDEKSQVKLFPSLLDLMKQFNDSKKYKNKAIFRLSLANKTREIVIIMNRIKDNIIKKERELDHEENHTGRLMQLREEFVNKKIFAGQVIPPLMERRKINRSSGAA